MIKSITPMKTILTSALVLLSLVAFCKKDWTFTTKEKQIIAEAVAAIPDSTRQRFEKNYKAWKDACDKDLNVRLSSRTDASKNVKEYKTLVDMGKKIIPLLIQKMSEDINRNFFDLVPYNDLEGNTRLKVTIMTSEQERAYRTVLLWITDNKKKELGN